MIDLNASRAGRSLHELLVRPTCWARFSGFTQGFPLATIHCMPVFGCIDKLYGNQRRRLNIVAQGCSLIVAAVCKSSLTTSPPLWDRLK